MPETYIDFLTKFNIAVYPYTCACGGNATLFRETNSLDKIKQFCKRELVIRLFRHAKLNVHNQNHAKFMKENKLLSVEELAEQLGYTSSYIAQLANKGKIPYLRIGHRVRFAVSEIDSIKAYLENAGRMDKRGAKPKRVYRKGGSNAGTGTNTAGADNAVTGPANQEEARKTEDGEIA